MSEQPGSPPGVQVYETRVYFDARSGHIISTHQLISAAGERLSSEEAKAEMDGFEASLRERRPDATFLRIGSEDLQAILDEKVSVDVESESLVSRSRG